MKTGTKAIGLAGWLLLCFATAWIGFASFLNFALWQMNRGSGV